MATSNVKRARAQSIADIASLSGKGTSPDLGGTLAASPDFRRGAERFVRLMRDIYALPELLRPGFSPEEDDSMRFNFEGAWAAVKDALAGLDRDRNASDGFARALGSFMIRQLNGLDVRPLDDGTALDVDYLLAADEEEQASAIQDASLMPAASTLTNVDGLSQEVCEELGALAQAIAAAMDEPRIPRDRVKALARIVGDKAANLSNSINSMAESAGANWRDAYVEARHG